MRSVLTMMIAAAGTVIGALAMPMAANAATVTVNGDTTGNATWNRPYTTGGTLSGIGNDTPFEVIEFSVDTAGDYEFEITSANFDSYIFLYNEAGFDPFNQALGLQALDDDGGPSLLSLIASANGDNATLAANLVYYIVVSGFNNADFGAFALDISGNGNIALGATEVPLPAALPLFLAGIAGLGAAGRRRKARTN
ncbi:VPLPA-CTERM sorting domain-containing protein [Hyphococcus lacteus]|uniref:VPLPA-CTERM sorting domain-containing protein n=1 Tax=Hyphococcus lacteus TaxID=3143536 RepID=A0ABV3Z4W5_9PROT